MLRVDVQEDARVRVPGRLAFWRGRPWKLLSMRLFKGCYRCLGQSNRAIIHCQAQFASADIVEAAAFPSLT
jgi:hypothetical protein